MGYAQLSEPVQEDIFFDALTEDVMFNYQKAVELANSDGRRLVATAILFSGGNDSTTVAHMFRGIANVAVHANTGIGIEQTRQYVRDTCQSWNIPLIEKGPKPNRSYRELVLGEAMAQARDGSGLRPLWKGFPSSKGPSHNVMFNKLKQDAIDAAKRELVSNPRKERIIFVGGIRRAESARRKKRTWLDRNGSAVNVSPIINWSKLDMNEYRRRNPDVPRNEVSDLIHMSGECLCGAFAHPGELDEIAFWFPDVADEIRQLEREAKERGIERCRWGGGGGTPCEGICNL